ncbi:MBL fold metallo-hydrolase, partial [Pseudoalteromonas sp. 0303]
ENTKNGDAIVIRYGKEGNYKIMVVDGGTKESGKQVVEHIKNYYGTSYVDYVVNTHPDIDHVSGLVTVLEELEVGELWMHLPWEHSSEIRDMFKDGRITDNSLSERIKNSLNKAHQLYEIAIQKEIPIYEPFAGEY